MRAIPLLAQSEEDVQRLIIEALTLFGYTVEQTSVRIKLTSCPQCATRFRPAGAYGATEGVPDLLIRHSLWPTGLRMALEVKRPHKWKWSSEEQRLKWERGETFKATTLEAACYAIWHFERFALRYPDCLRLEVQKLASALPKDKRCEVANGLK